MPLCGSAPKPVQRKIVILGDGACGKTSLLNVFTRGYFPQVYEPTVFENYIHDIFIDGQPLQLSLWDTAGQEEFDRLRSLSYNDTHCIILCFSIDSMDSLENVKNKWVGEILEHCDGVKLILVALKADLRANDDGDSSPKPDETADVDQQQLVNGTTAYYNNGQMKRLVTYEEGLAVAKSIGALRYLECSAMKNRGVNEVFTEAARLALTAKPKGAQAGQAQAGAKDSDKDKGCVIM
ncbi:unnamed protein product [Ambrosiozyma monospora]|uniref:GTP-binding protein RHO3 n=1 Tax=Ambrosiozyma monospora TaxID=43982 RepID=A0A9W7DFL0_AMBMO|nr:unnamed protein product [Ambrosiozyma monospora]